MAVKTGQPIMWNPSHGITLGQDKKQSLYGLQYKRDGGPPRNMPQPLAETPPQRASQRAETLDEQK